MQDENLSLILRDTILALVREDGPDLSARQLAVLLICYLEDGMQTVRGLAARLAAPKPAITRALDRLEEFNFTQRRKDPRDRRSIVVDRTPIGFAYVEALQVRMNIAAA
jgi:DNA-binding MarR family transcriptional regulator